MEVILGALLTVRSPVMDRTPASEIGPEVCGAMMILPVKVVQPEMAAASPVFWKVKGSSDEQAEEEEDAATGKTRDG